MNDRLSELIAGADYDVVDKPPRENGGRNRPPPTWEEIGRSGEAICDEIERLAEAIDGYANRLRKKNAEVRAMLLGEPE